MRSRRAAGSYGTRLGAVSPPHHDIGGDGPADTELVETYGSGRFRLFRRGTGEMMSHRPATTHHPYYGTVCGSTHLPRREDRVCFVSEGQRRRRKQGRTVQLRVAIARFSVAFTYVREADRIV